MNFRLAFVCMTVMALVMVVFYSRGTDLAFMASCAAGCGFGLSSTAMFNPWSVARQPTSRVLLEMLGCLGITLLIAGPFSRHSGLRDALALLWVVLASIALGYRITFVTGYLKVPVWVGTIYSVSLLLGTSMIVLLAACWSDSTKTPIAVFVAMTLPGLLIAAAIAMYLPKPKPLLLGYAGPRRKSSHGSMMSRRPPRAPKAISRFGPR